MLSYRSGNSKRRTELCAALSVGLIAALVSASWATRGLAIDSALPKTKRVVPGSNGLVAYLTAERIAIMNPDGSSRRLVTPANVGGFRLRAEAPAWSPDGKRIAFIGRRCPTNGTCRPDSLFVVNPDGTALRAVTDIRVTFSGSPKQKPAWSPSGAEIAIAISPTNVEPGNVTVVETDGSGRRLLVRPESNVHVSEPVWSPDGSTIAYHRSEPPERPSSTQIGPQSIWLTDSFGTNPRRLFSASPQRHVEVIDWSPDGTRLLFAHWGLNSEKGGAYSLNVNTREVKELLGDEESWFASAWSPDGSAILVTGSGVSVMKSDGSGKAGGIRLLRADGRDGDWQRCGNGVPCRLPLVSVALAPLKIRPVAPKSGGELTATSEIRATGGKRVAAEDYSCDARVGTQPLMLLRKGLTPGTSLRCTWRVPRSARGARVTLKLTAVVDRRVARQTLSRVAVVRIS